MSRSVILDTDFLSAFLKIKRLSLVKEFYQVEFLIIPAAVYKELSATSLSEVLAKLSATSLSEVLAKLPWIQVESPTQVEDPTSVPDYVLFGAGELQAIALARQCDQALILSNDNSARKLARRLGVTAIDIPEFLLSCKESGHLDQPELQRLIRDLQEKDYYGFRKEVLDRLLS